MNQTLIRTKAALTALAFSLSALLGWKGVLALVWVIAMGLDYLSGSLAAIKNRQWCSETARQGLWHKAGMILVVLVSALTDGVIYHTFPVTLFENREAGDLTFDITYKEHRGGRATINFTCRMAQAVPADSVRFAADAAVMSGPVDKLYLEPEKKQWKHRYTFDADGSKLCGFFDERALPEVTVYVGGKPYVYRAKRSAWRSYAPIGYRIFDMIRVNEQ